MFASANLAPWHNFKHGVELLWKHFAHEIFAPMYHFLYPQNKFAIKYQSPQEPLVHMMLLAHAYPTFKPALTAAMNDPEATKPNLSLLADIEFLCEFGIPAVRQYSLFPRDIERTCMYIVTSRGTKINFNLLLFFDRSLTMAWPSRATTGSYFFNACSCSSD
jgi:hypothetical protein